VLKTLENYLTDAPTRDWLLEPLWQQLGHDRRFSKIFIASIVGHLVFYAVLVRLDLKMEFRAPRYGQPQEVVKIIELAPPADKKGIQRPAIESPERADISQLKYDPNNANDRNLISRSPNPTTARGVETRLPSASQIEKQVQATRARTAGGSNTTASAAGNTPAAHPPDTTEVKPTPTPPPNTPVTAQPIPQPTPSEPPAPPAPKPSETTAKAEPPTPAPRGTSGGTSNQSRAFGMQEMEAQYNAYVRTKIKNLNERYYPKALVRDLLNDRVSADFELIIRRGGDIASLRQLRSTGFSALDNIARQAIQTAKPFDGYPSNAGDTITLTVTVYYAPLR
jgi:outer membrane biosynthesis protein TonB